MGRGVTLLLALLPSAVLGLRGDIVQDVLPLAIEAPHSYDDLHTGDLAETLFLESHAAAAAWDTVSRSLRVEGKKETAESSQSVFVLSDGTRSPPTWLLQGKQCLHIEISLAFRCQLTGGRDLRKKFWSCIPDKQP